MKYKKYIIVLLLVLFLGCNKTYALSLDKNNNQNQEIKTTMINNVELNNNIQLLAKTKTTTKTNTYSTSNKNDIDCDSLFTKEDKELINEILQYPRIIVPILVILFGTLDLAKAVIAGKEDEMTKAKKTFTKRVLVGVTFFLIPAIINIVMYFADIVWEGLGYTSCGI